MKQTLIIALFLVPVVGVMAGVILRSGKKDEQVITLKGAVQFGEDHAFTRTIRKFEELVKENYDKPVEFELHLNSELGLEKDYFVYMSLGIAVDYGIVSPAHMSTFSESAPLMDMPFLFRDIDHWNNVLESDALQPIRDEISEKADVRLMGYAGGGVRNLIVNKPITNMQELKGLSMRVMGAPIQTRIFQAIGASPSVIAYSEVYNAIQTGVIDAAENEAAGIQQMKFYEVGPEICQTQHAITVRPLCFSPARFPGTMAGPDSPPFSRNRTRRASNPPFTSSSSPWHCQQCALRIGRTSVSNRNGLDSSACVPSDATRQRTPTKNNGGKRCISWSRWVCRGEDSYPLS